MGVLFCGEGVAAVGAAGLVVAAADGVAAGAFVTRTGTARAGVLFVAGAAGCSAACALSDNVTANDRSLRSVFTVNPAVEETEQTGTEELAVVAETGAHDGVGTDELIRVLANMEIIS